MDFIITDIKYELPGGITRIEIRGFNPGRPAPVCSNPDSPLFSDMGDDADIDEIEIFCNIAGIEFNLEEINPDLFYQVYDKILDRIFDICFDEFDKTWGEY